MLVPRSRLIRFVVIFTGRVGSTYFISALDSHPDIAAEGERLADIRRDGPDAQLAWTRRFLRGAPLGRRRAVGFKTKTRDVLDTQGFAAVLKANDARVVTMLRRNDVKTAVSRLTGLELKRRTGSWNRSDDVAQGSPITVDPELLDTHLDRLVEEKKQVRDYVRELGLRTLQIEYEDLLTRPDAVFEEALEFLGVPPAPLATSTAKNTSDDLREAIANFHEVRARYAGTPYEPMFDEVLVP